MPFGEMRMDTLRGFEDDRLDADHHDEADLRVDDNPGFDIGSDERRMHVRAYNYWVSLLGGRPYPSIADLIPDSIVDFSAHSVLLDFTGGIENPTIQFLGRALREECDLDITVTRIAEVPSRSLLSRLTDHYLQIIANRAPIGFEAEFVGVRGHNTMYRGILMPFSSDGDTIDFIYGVINWKEQVDTAMQATLDAEVAAAVRNAPRAVVTAPAWASGPSAGIADVEHAPGEDQAPAEATTAEGTLPLADQLVLAQQSAASVLAADSRSRAALYRALGRAYDFAAAADGDPEGYAALLADAGISAQARAPMTPVAKLVFGADYDKTRLTEFAAVLTHARRANIPAGALGDFLDMAEGGIKGVVAAERALRRPAAGPDGARLAAERLRGRPPMAQLAMAHALAEGDLVVLVARAGAAGMFDIVGSVATNDPLTARAIARAAR